MADHSRLAFSSAERWVACPGSVMLEAQFPDTQPRDEAEFGTAAHWLAQVRYASGQPEGILVAPNGMQITGEIQDIVTEYLELLRSHGVEMYVEHRLGGTSIHPEAGGTIDALGFDQRARIAYIDDLKTGHGYVEVFENWQLVGYAVIAMDMIGPQALDWTYEMRIFQPRCYHRDGTIRLWSATGHEIARLARAMRSSAEDAMGNNPSTMPGPHCKHCRARHACTALRNAGLDAVEMASSATPEVLPPEGLALELSLMTRALKRLEARISGLEAQAMAEIRAGRAVPGWKIEHAAGREEWTKPVEEITAIGDLMGVKVGKVGLITPKQARDAGLADAIVAQYSARKTGTAKLIEATTLAARKAFGGQ